MTRAFWIRKHLSDVPRKTVFRVIARIVIRRLALVLAMLAATAALVWFTGCAHAPASRLAAEARADAQAAQTNLRTGAQRIQRGEMDAAWHSLVAADRQIGNALDHLRELEGRQ